MKHLRAAAFWTWIDLYRPRWTRMSALNLSRGPLLALPLLFALGGCMTTSGPASVTGTCPAFEAPKYAVRGATQHDQDWIDPTIEGGVGACKWARPAPRPPEWDAVPLPKPRPVAKKKRSLLQRAKANIWPKADVAPVVAVPEAPAPAPLPPLPAPRSAIDELLNPADSK